MKCSKLFFILLTIISFNHDVNCAKILSVYSTFSRSHYIVAEAILLELAKQGHEVTSVSAFPQKKEIKNFRDIKIDLDDDAKAMMNDMLANSDDTFFFIKNIRRVLDIYFKTAETIVLSPKVQKLMKEESFDLFIMEGLSTNCLLGIGYHFGAPTVAVSSFETTQMLSELIGNPEPVSFVPKSFSSFKGPMTFKERVINYLMASVFNLIHQYNRYLDYKFYNKYFPSPEYPTLNELQQNVSLAFVNYHFSQGTAKPNVPGLIEIGGIQVNDPPAPLPQDIEKWISESENGVIYMSMGTNIKSSSLSQSTLDAIIYTFSNLKERVIWKFENESIATLPKNVLISKWLPQADLLAHPKIKLFITHGGLGSIIEAKYHGVPLVGVPIFGDQHSNLRKCEQSGTAQILPYTNLTKENFERIVNEVLQNPVYKQNAKYESDLYRDRPQKPREAAVFWIEYVLRHRGAPHLKSNAVYLNTWQLNSLDVIGFLLVTILILGFILTYILRIIWALCLSPKIKNKKD